MSENPNAKLSVEQRLEKIELYQQKASEAITIIAKGMNEMNDKLNIVLDILNTFSIMVSEDDEDYDDDEIEDFENSYDDDEDEDDDNDFDPDSDSTWVPRPDIWDFENNDNE